MRSALIGAVTAATLSVLGAVPLPQSAVAAPDLPIGAWVQCKGAVGTIEGMATRAPGDDPQPKGRRADPVYVVQLWQPAVTQIRCPRSQLRRVQEPQAQQPAQPASPAVSATKPGKAKAPVAQQTVRPVPAAGAVRDGRYSCGKIVGGGGAFMNFGTFTIRGGRLMGSPLPNGWSVVSITNGARNPRGVALVNILYRTASGNTDLLDCEPA